MIHIIVLILMTMMIIQDDNNDECGNTFDVNDSVDDDEYVYDYNAYIRDANNRKYDK